MKLQDKESKKRIIIGVNKNKMSKLLSGATKEIWSKLLIKIGADKICTEKVILNISIIPSPSFLHQTFLCRKSLIIGWIKTIAKTAKKDNWKPTSDTRSKGLNKTIIKPDIIKPRTIFPGRPKYIASSDQKPIIEARIAEAGAPIKIK